MPLQPSRRQALQSLAAGSFALACPSWAQSPYPSRTVKMVVGSPPGGPSDFMARMFGDALSPALGQSFVVENKPGASGMPAADTWVIELPTDRGVFAVPEQFLHRRGHAPFVRRLAQRPLTEPLQGHERVRLCAADESVPNRLVEVCAGRR